MNIAVPVAAYHEYNTAVYVVKAFERLGHEARVITQAQYYEDLPDVALFFGVDSAGPLDFPEKHRAKTAMWFIDSRHNCDPQLRQPDDDTNAQTLADGGGWVFQAQRLDWRRNFERGILRSTWLPLAADPEVWRPIAGAERILDVGFGGNVWCETRRHALDMIARRFTLGQFTGTPGLLAQGYSTCRVGFNVSTRYGGDKAYDVNMRVFEIMACGLPLVTNELPDYQLLGWTEGWHYHGYRNLEDAMGRIREVLNLLASKPQRVSEMGKRARALIVDGHTYEHRLAHALEVLAEAGVCDA